MEEFNKDFSKTEKYEGCGTRARPRKMKKVYSFKQNKLFLDILFNDGICETGDDKMKRIIDYLDRYKLPDSGNIFINVHVTVNNRQRVLVETRSTENKQHVFDMTEYGNKNRGGMDEFDRCMMHVSLMNEELFHLYKKDLIDDRLKNI